MAAHFDDREMALKLWKRLPVRNHTLFSGAVYQHRLQTGIKKTPIKTNAIKLCVSTSTG
jgi:hypothetical protein